MRNLIVNKDYFSIEDQLIKFVIELIENDNAEGLHKLFNALHPASAALLIQFLSLKHIKYLIQALGLHLDPEILSYLNEKTRSFILPFFANTQLVHILNTLNERDALEILENLDEETFASIVIDSNKSKVLTDALQYPENSVGRLLEYNYISMLSNKTVLDAKKLLNNLESLDKYHQIIVVVDQNRCPIGQVNIISFFKCSDEITLGEICKNFISVMVCYNEIKDAAYIFRKYNLDYMPVIDYNGSLVGIISSITMIEVIYEELQEDLLQVAGLHSSDFYDNFLKAAYKRLYWIVISLCGSYCLLYYSNLHVTMLESVPKLMFIVPLINNINNSCSIQIATIVTQALNDRFLKNFNFFNLLFKEFVIALLNSLFLSALLFCLLSFLKLNYLLIKLVVFVLITSMVLNALIAALLPYLLNKVNVDPTLSTNAVLNAIIDFTVMFVVVKMVCFLYF